MNGGRPWRDVESESPELAAKVRTRFEAHGLGFMATLRKDGSPRLSGIEPLFGEGELWLGMMPDSLKAADLLRDPRVALHSAGIDKNVADGDAKIAGLAIPVEDEETYAVYSRAAGTGYRPDFGTFHLFRVDVTGISHLAPAGDHLNIEWWTPRGGYRQLDRR